MYTIDQYEAFKKAFSQGALRVKYGDKEVEYRSLKEMLAIMRLMENELFPEQRTSGRTYAKFSKGIK